MPALFFKAIQQPIDYHEWHGHVRPRPDGVRARCGGVAFCSDCQKEQAQVEHDRLNGVRAQPNEMDDAAYAKWAREPAAGDRVEFGSDALTDKGPATASILEVSGSRVKIHYGADDAVGEWIDWPSSSDLRRVPENGTWMLKALPPLRGHRGISRKISLLVTL